MGRRAGLLEFDAVFADDERVDTHGLPIAVHGKFEPFSQHALHHRFESGIVLFTAAPLSRYRFWNLRGNIEVLRAKPIRALKLIVFDTVRPQDQVSQADVRSRHHALIGPRTRVAGHGVVRSDRHQFELLAESRRGEQNAEADRAHDEPSHRAGGARWVGSAVYFTSSQACRAELASTVSRIRNCRRPSSKVAYSTGALRSATVR